MTDHSDYIVYVDESGDHGLTSIDPQYPVFVLAFCIFHKESYRAAASPALQELKFRYFGHDMVVLHEHEIRKATGPFKLLVDLATRERFMQDLNRLIESMPVTLVASVIHKLRLRERYSAPQNPYHIALAFGLERVASFLRSKGQAGRVTHLVFECRGKKEDAELSAEFREGLRRSQLSRRDPALPDYLRGQEDELLRTSTRGSVRPAHRTQDDEVG